MAVGTAQIEDANKHVIRKAFDEWAAGTGGIWGLLDQDLTWTVIGTGPISGRYHSRQDFLDQVITQIDRRLSDPLSPTVRGIYADGDMVIVRFDAAGTARDGQPYRNSFTWYLRMEQGQVVEGTAFFDTLALNDLWQRVTPG